MKILISISYYAPHISGLTNATKNFAELLTKNGYQVTVLATQHDKRLVKQEEINGVRVKRIPYLFKLYKGFIMPNFIFSSYQALQDSEQVIINLPQAEGFIVAILAKLMKKKIHCIYHCNLVFSHSLRALLVRFIFHIANSITFALTDTIVMSSDDFAKHTSLYRKYHKKIQIIPLVIYEPIQDKSIQTSLTKKLSKKRYKIGFIGRIAAEKGIQYLLETIPILKKRLGDNFSLVLAGPEKVVGEQKYLDKITTMFIKYDDDIVKLGELRQNELSAFYRSLDVLVLPSVNNIEAFGMVQVEAMFCGTPVVVSDLPGVRVAVQTTKMGEIVPSQNPSALAVGIIKVLKNKTNYIKKQKQIDARFSKEEIISQWKNLFIVKC